MNVYKKYYKCDICDKAVTSVAKVRAKGVWTSIGKINPTFVICSRCFSKLIDKVRGESE